MYVLEMLPYPSGELHMGHVKNYTMGDVVTLVRRRNGWRVMHPMGYDAFGLPAENAAIKSGQHPAVSTRENIAAIRKQMKRMGWSIDWTREVSTCEPEYYKWTQWIFLRLFEAGLAYRREAPVKWCPVDQTVLANEQVIDGHCERCGSLVEAKNLEQWFFKITDYAQRLLDDLETVNWPERVVTMQRNWIGRSEGAEVVFRVEHDPSIELPVFTTRPDTLFGATFFVLAPEHPLAIELARGTEHEAAVVDYVRRTAALSEVERAEEKQKTGVFTGRNVDQSGQRRGDPRLGRRLRADGVRHRRDHGGAGPRRARPRVRDDVRPADPPGGRPAGRRRRIRRGRGVRRPLGRRGAGQLRRVHRAAARRTGKAAIIAWLEEREPGPRPHRVPAARLAAVAAALLGLPDPDRPLRGLRHRRRARRPAAGRAAGHPGLRAEGPLAAGVRRGLGQRQLPVVRRAGPARDRHDGHVRRLVLVLPALRRPAQRPGAVRPAQRSTPGCRSTSTSAASSTRSCT